MTKYTLANISFSLEGSGSLVDILRDKFAAIQDGADGKAADIRFCFVERLPDMGAYLSIPPLKAGEGVYEAEQGGVTYQVRALKPGFEVSIHVRDDAGDLRAEATAKRFLSGIFDPLTQLVHLENNTSYLRASSFEKDGRAVALVGWGDVGTSTSLLDQMGEEGWRFLSDDLGLINRDGIVSPNISRQSDSEFFDPARAGSPTKLTDLYFMERANVPSLKLQSISVPDIARQSTVSLLHRLQPCVEHATALHSGSYYPILPRPDDLYQRCFNITRQGFAAQGPSLIRMPLQAGPDELARFLKRKLDA